MNWTTYATKRDSSKIEKKISKLVSAAPLTAKQQKQLAALMRESGGYTEEEITYMMSYTK